VAAILAAGLERYLDPTPQAWQQSLEEIIAADMQASLPEDPVLVVGGQRVRLWKNLPEELAPVPTLLRPLGDATIEDISHYYNRLIGYYQPRVLVIFPGYADLHLRDSKSPEDFRRAVKGLLSVDESYDRTRLRVIIVPLMTPLHPGDDERIRAMAQIAAGLEKEHPNLLSIDPNGLLQAQNGRPDPAFFQSDGINLNSNGYARMAFLLEDRIRRRSSLAGQQRQDRLTQ
jgi:lysophospholipase L1-like esterase